MGFRELELVQGAGNVEVRVRVAAIAAGMSLRARVALGLARSADAAMDLSAPGSADRMDIIDRRASEARWTHAAPSGSLA